MSFKLYLLLVLLGGLLSCERNFVSMKEKQYPDTNVHYLGKEKQLHIYLNDTVRELQGYNQNEKMVQHAFFIHDKKDGIEELWYETGEPMAKIHYKNGKQHGELIVWNMDGSIKKVEKYKNGELMDGEIIQLDEDFHVQHTKVLKDGKVYKIDSSETGKYILDVQKK